MNIEYVVLYKSMVKHTKKHEKSLEENIKELEDEIKTAEIDVDIGADPQDEIERKREELIKLAEDGQFEKNVNTIKKRSNKIIEKNIIKNMKGKECKKRMNF